MQHLLRFALRRRLLPGLRCIDRFCRDPLATQVRVLRRLLTTAADTEWGRRFGFARIARQADVIAAYQQTVPIGDYSDFCEDIARMRAGSDSVLWPGHIRRFATSAGTTSRGKHCPASNELIRASIRHGANALLCYLAETGNLACLQGLPVTLTGRVEVDPVHPEVRVGEISGLGAEYWYTRGRLWQRLLRRQNIPGNVRQIADWDRKLDAVVDYAMSHDVRTMAMVPSWGLQLFDRLIDRYNHRHGTAVTTVGQIWPRLQLIVAGGVPLRAYREALLARIGLPHVDLIEVYGASEAPIAFQSARQDSSMLLNLDNDVFFEFIRLEDLTNPTPRRWTIAEVQTNLDYVPIVTTCGGLWAYRIGDVLRFTQLAPPKLVVVGRTTEMLDSYGEFVRGDEARDAVEHACRQTDRFLLEFHVAPRPAVDGRRHAHQWLIEFDAPPADLQAFAETLDTRLRQRNAAYDCCRREKGFGPPEIVPLGKGTFHAWLRVSRERFGAQSKVPSMSDQREIAEAVLAIHQRQSGVSDWQRSRDCQGVL